MQLMETVEVDEKEKQMLLLYRSLPDNKKEIFYQMLMSLQAMMLK